MNVGDKVRMLRGREEGILVRKLPDDLWEVEIEEGFRIPVHARELAGISPEEARRFGKEPELPSTKETRLPGPVADSGLFMGFVPINDRELALHLLNNTDWDVPFVLYSGTEPHLRQLAAGLLKARTGLGLKEPFLIEKFEEWGVFSFQGLFSRVVFMKEREPLQKKLRFRGNTFFKNKQRLPLLDKNGYLFSLDETPLNPVEVATAMQQPAAGPPPRPVKAEELIDLHAEKLGLPADENVLVGQLTAFEQALENALAAGLASVTFIHGVGNGILRNEIHRRLGRHKQVQFFEDARKEKFGYGATKAVFK